MAQNTKGCKYDACVTAPAPNGPDPVAMQMSMRNFVYQNSFGLLVNGARRVWRNPVFQAYVMVFAFEASGEDEEGAEAGAEEAGAQEGAALEATPTTDPSKFRAVRGTKGKENIDTKEVFEKDMFHKNHYEVYKNRKMYEKGIRDRSVWEDGRLKEKF